MAALNFTETLGVPCAQGSCAFARFGGRHEKISSWISDFSRVGLPFLMDKRVRVAETTLGYDLDFDGAIPQTIIYEAVVVAFQIGSKTHGIETSLLLKHDGLDDFDYVDVSSLVVLDVI